MKLTVLGERGPLVAAASGKAPPSTKLSELWARFPYDAILAVAGRFEPVAFADQLATFFPEDARKDIREAIDRGAGAALGRDVRTEILPCVGPDWGLCIAAPPPEDKDWFPHVVAALRVRPGADGPPVDQALFNALNGFAMLAIFGYNNEHKDQMSLKTELQDKIEVRFLVNDKRFPPGLRPAFALKDGYLVLASSPRVIRRFVHQVAPKPGTSTDDEIPLVRLSLRHLRSYLKARQSSLAAHMVEKQNVTLAEAERRLTNFQSRSQLVEAVEISDRSDAGRACLILRVHTSQPLRQ